MSFGFFLTASFSLFFACAAHAAEMRIAVTTSFQNSGLAEVLLPQIKRDLDLDVRLIVVGTGQALKLGRSGDVDAILVHSKRAEEKFVKEGFANHRREIMFNDFVLIGPSEDTAKIAGAKSAKDALQKIATSNSIFVSRGDDSGTHRTELKLWQSANIAKGARAPDWYRSVGSGMGATLNTASAMYGYVISDRATWLKFENKGNLKLLYSGDPALFNQYAYLPINEAKHPHVKSRQALQLEKWLVGKKAQGLIGQYTINGQPLFTPNANP